VKILSVNTQNVKKLPVFGDEKTSLDARLARVQEDLDYIKNMQRTQNRLMEGYAIALSTSSGNSKKDEAASNLKRSHVLAVPELCGLNKKEIFI
jgi:hypothetical protein